MTAPAVLDVDRLLWEAGEVRPWRITLALDAAGLHGPDVDAVCGATEPEVDWWEAGILYPTFEQLVALADLTGMAVAYFLHNGQRSELGTMFICSRGGRGSGCEAVEPDEPVLFYDYDVVRATVGDL